MIEFSVEAAIIALLLAGIAIYASCTAYRRRKIETIHIMATSLALMFIEVFSSGVMVLVP